MDKKELDTIRALKTTGRIVLIQNKEGFMIEGSHVYTRPAAEYIKMNTEGFYMYDLRHGESDWSRPYWLQRYGSILLNYFGIVIMKEPIKFGKDRVYYTVRDNGKSTIIFSDMENITLKEYLEENYERID